MSWYNKQSIKTASPKSQIQKYKITEPNLTLFVYKYENIVPWKDIVSKEDLVDYIREMLLPDLYSQIDPTSDNNNYRKDIDLEDYFANHMNNPQAQQAYAVYKQNPERAKQIILEDSNNTKKDAFFSWWSYLTKENDLYKEDPAFVYLILRPVIDSSPETKSDPPLSDNAEAISTIYDLIQGTEGKQDFNVVKKYRKEWSKLQRKDIHVTNVKTGDGWLLIPSKGNDPENYESNLKKLMGLASGTGWCVAGRGMATKYLSGGDFWLYIQNNEAVVAIRFGNDAAIRTEDGQTSHIYGMAEIRGHDNKKPYEYTEEIISFVEEKGFDQRVAFYQELYKSKVINENIMKDENVKKEFIESLKENPNQYDLLWKENRKDPEIRQSVLRYWSKQIQGTPRKYNEVPDDLKDDLEGTGIVVSHWLDILSSNITKINDYYFPKHLLKTHKKFAVNVSNIAEEQIFNTPWKLSKIPDDILEMLPLSDYIYEKTKTDNTYLALKELKDPKDNPEDIANNYGFESSILDGDEEIEETEDPDEEIDKIADEYEVVKEAIGQSWYEYASQNTDNAEEFEREQNAHIERYIHYEEEYYIRDAVRDAWETAINENPSKLDSAPEDIMYDYTDDDEGKERYREIWLNYATTPAKVSEMLTHYRYEGNEEALVSIIEDLVSSKLELLKESITEDSDILFENFDNLHETEFLEENSNFVRDTISSKLNKHPDMIDELMPTINFLFNEYDDYYDEHALAQYQASQKAHHVEELRNQPIKYHEIPERYKNDQEFIDLYHNKKYWIEYIYVHGESVYNKAPKEIQESYEGKRALQKYNILKRIRYSPDRSILDNFQMIVEPFQKRQLVFDQFAGLLQPYANDQVFLDKCYEEAWKSYLRIIRGTYNIHELVKNIKIIPEIFKNDDMVLDYVAEALTIKNDWLRYLNLDQIDPIIHDRIKKYQNETAEKQSSNWYKRVKF